MEKNIQKNDHSTETRDGKKVHVLSSGSVGFLLRFCSFWCYSKALVLCCCFFVWISVVTSMQVLQFGSGVVLTWLFFIVLEFG